MSHGITGPTGFGGRQTVLRSGTTAANIRNLIDTRSFTEAAHPTLLGQPPSALSVGGIVIPGGIPSTIPWGDIIRDQIDRLFFGGGGDGNGGSLLAPQGPVTDLPMVPDFIDRMLSGTLPRGAVSFIDLPNGMTGCPSGYHPEKSGKSYCVRNRRMNALNPRALSRAGRRVGGFARAVKRARTLKKVCKSL